MNTRIIFLGAPGSGKGTQASRLSEYLKIPHVDTGSILRAAVSEGTELGKTAKSFMDNGQLVPSEIVIAMIKERLLKNDCQNGFILDGFPRSIEQARGLDEILSEIAKDINYVLNIDVSESVLIDRMAFRRICKGCGEKFNLKFTPPANETVCDRCGGELYQRSDDSEENAVRRIATYKSETEPLINYYKERNLLHNIDGNNPIEKIFESILKTLNIHETCNNA